MEPFKEFDEPTETSVTQLDDGSYLVETTNSPPVAWRTGFLDYDESFAAQEECRRIYWSIDKLAAIDMLTGVIQRFREKHMVGLQEAAQDHELGGQEKWPVEQHLALMKELHASMVIYEANDPWFNSESRSK